MEENVPTIQAAPAKGINWNHQPRNNARNDNGNGSRPVCVNNQTGPIPSTPRNFEGVTPQIGGILALRSENMIKKVSYDQFCEKLHTYIVNNFKNGDAIVGVT